MSCMILNLFWNKFTTLNKVLPLWSVFWAFLPGGLLLFVEIFSSLHFLFSYSNVGYFTSWGLLIFWWNSFSWTCRGRLVSDCSCIFSEPLFCCVCPGVKYSDLLSEISWLCVLVSLLSFPFFSSFLQSLSRTLLLHCEPSLSVGPFLDRSLGRSVLRIQRLDPFRSSTGPLHSLLLE